MRSYLSRLLYAVTVAQIIEKKNSLRALREAAGLSQRELARLIDQDQSNIHFWEVSGTLPRSNVLIPMARVLGVTVGDLLGQTPSRKRKGAPPGKLGLLFEAVTCLPRRQQQKIIEILEPFVAQHANGRVNVV